MLDPDEHPEPDEDAIFAGAVQILDPEEQANQGGHGHPFNPFGHGGGGFNFKNFKFHFN